MACYIPMEHGGDDMFAERPEQLPAELVLAKLKPLLEDPAVLKIGHNMKFDWVLLDRRGICMRPYDDSLVMSFNLDAGGLASHAMDDLARKHLDHQCLTYKEVCGSGQKQIKFNEVPLARATEYAAEDADVTLRLWKRFKARLPMERVAQVYERVDRPLVEVIARMERDGVKVDEAALQGLSAQFNVEITSLEEKICAEAGCQFTIGSPKQLGDILFDKMGLKGGRKGKSGVWSTTSTSWSASPRRRADRADGARVAPAHQAQDHLYRRAAAADQPRDRPRPHQLLAVRRADRPPVVDRSQPPEHPDPHRDRPPHPRRFIAEPGNVVLAADYSQIELRLAAHMADVPQLKERSRPATTFTA
jgi:DNA polymerase-1